MTTPATLPLPTFHDPERVGEVWRVDYEARAGDARRLANVHGIRPAAQDQTRVGLLAIDVQNTFCLPGFALYVAGSSGTAAVDDNRRLCAFLYGNLHRITRIEATLDTHQAAQIFHALFLVDEEGRHPEPHTQVTVEDITSGRWRFNQAVAPSLGVEPDHAQRHLEHYVKQLAERDKFELTIWPYHAMLGGIGHALVPAVEEAIFVHGLARYSQARMHTKGRDALTEAYSAVGPEVTTGPDGEPIAQANPALPRMLEDYDAVIIAGQAKSHCVAWTVEDLLAVSRDHDPSLARKVYLLEDCTSPIVVPDVADYSDEADAAFARFAKAGMHVVRSTEPMAQWPGVLGEG